MSNIVFVIADFLDYILSLEKILLIDSSSFLLDNIIVHISTMF